MRKRGSLYITLMIVILLASILAIPAMADAGNFSGSSDFGGSYGGSSGGSFGGSGLWTLFALGSSGHSGGVIAIIIIAFIVIKILKNAGRRGGTATFTAARTNGFSELKPIQTLRDTDPNFSEAVMKEKIGNLYVRMQTAWQTNEFDSMRPFMTDSLYSQFKLQLDELIRSECTNHIERIAVLEVNLLGWRSDEANDAVVAQLQTRIIDYISNDKTGKVISGSKTAEKFMTYEWTLVRSKGMKTPEPSGEGKGDTISIHCPSCGAPVEINQSAKCPYCDSVINAVSYDWVISQIKGISQRTGR
ncbi:MAG: hypothetical protein CVU91_08520 [Firmicutes bacterium HGW-Firmicutes-16]|nr:MAG: hypothetical protein CVU91_08520 [Firmicutes bacterium HGW-Firmicutes-16]